MTNKKNINQTVSKIISMDMAIQKGLSNNIINSRALAKYVIKKYSLTASLDSVISAIRRFQSQENFEKEEKAVLHIFRDAVVSTKNNIACLTLELTPKEFFQKMSMFPNSRIPLKVVTGTREVKILFENTYLKNMKEMFTEDDIKITMNNLSEISVKVSERALRTKGVLARISSELALARINVDELLVIPPEFLIYVKQKDIVKAHEAMMKLTKPD